MRNPVTAARSRSRVAAGVREGSVRGPEADDLLRARLEAALAQKDPLRRRTALLDLADVALSIADAVGAPPYEPLVTTSGGYRITERERLEAVSSARRVLLELEERRVARAARVAASAGR